MGTDRNFNYYGQIASRYDEIVRNAGYTLENLVFERVAKLWPIQGLDVLDLGIGTGLTSAPFAKAGGVVTGIDASAAILEVCAKKGFAKSLILADLSEGEIPALPDRFDVVLCIGLIEFVRNVDGFFRSVAAVLKPQGIFVVAIRDILLNPGFSKMQLNGLTIDAKAFEDIGLVAIHHDWLLMRDTIEKSGFEIIQQEEVFAYKSPTQHIDTINRLVFLAQTATQLDK